MELLLDISVAAICLGVIGVARIIDSHTMISMKHIPEYQNYFCQVFSTEQALPEPSQPTWQSLHPSSKRHNAGLVQARLNDNPVMMHMLFRILDYVDRYWNGSKSLHQHAKFLGKYFLTSCTLIEAF